MAASNSSSQTQSSTQPRIHCIDHLPIELLPTIFSKLETSEQCQIRLVCHVWNNSIVKIFELTRYLKLNFTSIQCTKHKFTQNISMHSLQFESNWTEPALESDKKAQATVHPLNFSEDCANIIVRLFARIRYLVVYFDVCALQKEYFDNLIRMIKGFKEMESFSLIRSTFLTSAQFIPKLCDTIEEMGALRRLDLYVEQRSPLQGFSRRPITMTESLGCLEHFSLSSWPPVITQADQQMILQNVGESHEEIRKIINKQSKLISLCIPVHTQYLLKSRLDMAQVFGSNAELKNVERLQLTQLKCLDQVRQTVIHCPKLQSLGLFTTPSHYLKLDPNNFVELINQCEHLTELHIINGYIVPFREGPCAPLVRKLTIGKSNLFGVFKDRLDERDRDEVVITDLETWPDRVANEFVKLISLKFPSLQQLTVLSYEKIDNQKTRETVHQLKSMITCRLRKKLKSINVNINMWHDLYWKTAQVSLNL